MSYCCDDLLEPSWERAIGKGSIAKGFKGCLLIGCQLSPFLAKFGFRAWI
jgi:hypothetical protein